MELDTENSTDGGTIMVCKPALSEKLNKVLQTEEV